MPILHCKPDFYTAKAHFLIIPLLCIKLGMIISCVFCPDAAEVSVEPPLLQAASPAAITKLINNTAIFFISISPFYFRSLSICASQKSIASSIHPSATVPVPSPKPWLRPG